MNVIIDERFDMAYQTAITTSAARKRNPETPVKNEGSISAWRVATQRKSKPEATSTTKMKHPLTIMAVSRLSDHSCMARHPRMVSTQSSTMLCLIYLRLSLLISITYVFYYHSLISTQRLTTFFCTCTKPPRISSGFFSPPGSA